MTSRRGTGVVERPSLDADEEDDGCEDGGSSLEPAVIVVATKPWAGSGADGEPAPRRFASDARWTRA